MTVAELAGLDPLSPGTRAAFASALAQPAPIAEAEEIELAAKRMWEPVLGDGAGAREALAFSEFFAAIGFVKKYKPYGVKFAAPFGYSIFSLRPGRGFSVQLHRVAKVEAFHVLEPQPGAFVLLCGRDEWERHGARFVADWDAASPTGLARAPAAGDVYVVDALEVVHTVIGSTLEEFATTSNDAVERLHDQNEGSPTELPRVHPSLAEVLASCGSTVPCRRVARTGGAWRTGELDGDGVLVDLPEQGLRGWHATLARGERTRPAADDGAILTLTCLWGEVDVALAGGSIRLARGETVPVAPGVAPVVSGAGAESRVAACRVATELAVADLRSPGDASA